jgi:hypothetical protein
MIRGTLCCMLSCSRCFIQAANVPGRTANTSGGLKPNPPDRCARQSSLLPLYCRKAAHPVFALSTLIQINHSRGQRGVLRLSGYGGANPIGAVTCHCGRLV